ncbi:hypothetical protein SAMD00023353_0302320 [Rosellinia necatrix]|uniref:Uncharacterized protein n=1 Tax=Rosellinia necatrix TaxID=77044 RepID=A0A1W2TDN7_ROSNE|nr:hypothetical protein SAMD00023353_0302320 [Rosellinia necatrix]
MNSEGTSFLNSAGSLESTQYGTYDEHSSTDRLDEQSSDDEKPSARVPDYRPIVLKWWFLAGLGILFATFGGLIELAIHKLPVKETGLTLFSRGFDGKGVNTFNSDEARLLNDSPSELARLRFPYSSTSHATLATPLSNTYSCFEYTRSSVTWTQSTEQITLVRPSPLTERTQEPSERPLREYGQHLWPLQPRIPSNSPWGSFGRIPVTFSSRPAPSGEPTTTPTQTVVITSDSSSQIAASSTPPSTGNDQPRSTLTITLSESPSLSSSAPVITTDSFSSMSSTFPTTSSASSQATHSSGFSASFPVPHSFRTTLDHSTISSTDKKPDKSTRSSGTELPRTSSDAPLVVIVQVSSGIPTSIITLEIAPPPVTSTLTDSNGTPTATTTLNMYSSVVETLSDESGAPTATVTLVAELTLITSTLTDQSGKPTDTATLAVPVTSRLVTITNAKGSPTRTLTLVPLSPLPTSSMPGNATGSQNTTSTEFFFISEADYFLGTFAAILVATVLSIPIRIIDLNAQRLQPFHELASSGGTTATYSLCREAGGLHSMIQDVGLLLRGRWPLTLLTTAMVVLSAFATTFSSEVFVLVLHGSCYRGGGSAGNCAYTIGVAVLGARITQAFFFSIAALIALTLLLLWKWQSGVEDSPWSIAGTASLLGHPDIREVLLALPTRGTKLANAVVQRELESYAFKLDHFVVAGKTHYGIVVCRQGRPSVVKRHAPLFGSCYGFKRRLKKIGPRRRGSVQPFFALSIPGRIITLLFLSGVIALIGYYNGPRTFQPFERFLDSESFAVRLLFTAFGVIITFAWNELHIAVSHLSAYRRMARSPQTAQHSIEISPPTNYFSGLVSAVLERDPYMSLVSSFGVLSEFLPILLSNVPYQVTQTLNVHLVSTWIPVGIMAAMVLIILGSFFVPWPPFPADVRTIAGTAYYLCDSQLIQNMVVSNFTPTQPPCEKYTFGEMMGVSGTRRVGVDTEGKIPVTERDSLLQLYERARR